MKNKSFGATFIELLVVLAIVAIFSAFALLNWRAGEQKYSLQRVATKLNQDIRRVANFATSTKDFNGQIPKGYGIYLTASESQHYILFADLNGDAAYNPGYDGIVEDINIEHDVKIDHFNNSNSPLTITFAPPTPTVTISSGANSVQIVIVIKNDPTQTKIITINKLGLVYVGN